MDDKEAVVNKLLGMPTHIKNEFERLANELSPENLTCDGELAGYIIEAKHWDLQRKWKGLEGTLGRKVSEREVWEWVMKR